MIINLIKNINQIKSNVNKLESTAAIRKGLKEGLNSIHTHKDTVIYRIGENSYIEVSPLDGLKNVFDDSDIRETKNFNLIRQSNSLKQEADRLKKEIREGLNAEDLALFDRYIELSENKPLFSVVMIESNEILHECKGIYFKGLYKLLLTYLETLNIFIEDDDDVKNE